MTGRTLLLVAGTAVAMIGLWSLLAEVSNIGRSVSRPLGVPTFGLLVGAAVVAIGAHRWWPARSGRRRSAGELRRENEALTAEVERLSGELERRSPVSEEVPLATHGDVELLATAVADTPLTLLATDPAGAIRVALGGALPPGAGSDRDGSDRDGLVGLSLFSVLPSLEQELRLALAGESAVGRVRDGDVVVEYRLSPRRDPQGAVVGIIAIGVDVSSFDEQEKLLRGIKASADAASAAKTRFVATMSHEIRTPLAAILGLAELLQLEEELPATAKQCADRIHAAADGLASLIGKVLDFSKIEAELVELDETEFCPVELMNNLKALISPQAAAKGLSLRIETAGNLPIFVGDSVRLQQVLVNLVGNAVKFTTEGEVQVRLERLAELDDGRWQLRCTVADTGPGIAPDDRERLFQPFAQADSSTARRFGGTGLGLTISKRLVELMGGAISVENRPGGGSLFAFTVTLKPVSSRSRTSELVASPSLVNPETTGARVLVVEDDEVSRLVVMDNIGVLGHQAIGVCDGRQALEALGMHRYDLILMDCQLPELNGYETTRMIRSLEAGDRRLPVVALTAHVMQGERDRCLEAGMDDFLSKPARLTELRDILDRWL